MYPEKRMVEQYHARNCKTARCYNETNNESGYCHDCENRKREDMAYNVAWHGCMGCGDTNDFMAYFTSTGMCARCVRKAHKKVVR